MKFSTEMQGQVRELFVAGLKAEFEGKENITVGEVEQRLRAMLVEIGAQSLGAYLSSQDEAYPADALACPCGGQAKYVSRKAAKVKSVFDWATYHRAYYLCAECHQGQKPLDQKLGLAPGKVTAGLADLLGVAGVETSFETGKQLIERYLLVEISENTLREETQAFGELQEKIEADWLEKSQDPDWLQEHLRTQPAIPQRLYGSLDGAHAPLNEEWREMKIGCWFEVEMSAKERVSNDRPAQVGKTDTLRAKHITYYCDLDQAEQFGKLLWATGCQRGADLAAEIVFIADGAAWIWNLVSLYYPQAVQIVDWYHAEGYLEPIAKALFPEDLRTRQHWLDETRTWLWEGQTQKVIAICAQLSHHPQAGDWAQKAGTYYANNQHRMDYARFREAGYLIGSGSVESGCKQIVTQRLKRPGARWTKWGARLTAKARAAWLSLQWDRLVHLRALVPLTA